MVGGSPIPFSSGFPMQYQAVPQVSAPRRPAAGVPVAGAVSSQPRTQAPPPRAVRAQTGEERPAPPRPAPTPASPAPVRIPSPEELGLLNRSTGDNTVRDWTAAHQRLQTLGASSV